MRPSGEVRYGPMRDSNSCGVYPLIEFSLRGLAQLSAGKRSRPIRPPVTVDMLTVLKATLRSDYSFDARF